MEKSVNLEAQVQLKNSWNAFAPAYDHYMHQYMLQPFTTLAVHCQVQSRKRILEVACGSGLHTQFLAKTMLQRGGVLVSTDISEEMIKLLQLKFMRDKDYESIKGNHFDIKVEEIQTQNFDLEAYLSKMDFDPLNERLVLGRLANNEALPFNDDSFDCYLSCLSLMLVDNHQNMLKEALRVTQRGCPLAFSVWGRKENIQNFQILEDVLLKHGLFTLPEAG